MKCSKCNKIKPKYKDKSLWCKECWAQYQLNWGRSPRGKASKSKYCETHKQHTKEYYSKWYIKNGRKRASDYIDKIKIWVIRNPEKRKAHLLVRYALKSNRIIKPKLCEKCHLKKKLLGHHEDYSKPLEVIWLCGSCHKLLHNTT